MNKKGFTMVELMISITIIAVVMVFLIQLLVDIRYDKVNELYNTANQFNRAEIIKTINNDLKDANIITISDSESSSNMLKITFTSSSSTSSTLKISTITIDGEQKDIIEYIDKNRLTKKWTLKTNNKQTYIQKNNIPYKLITSDNYQGYTVLIDIPIIVNKNKVDQIDPESKNEIIKKDNRMDNITIIVSGSIKDNIDALKYLNEQ